MKKKLLLSISFFTLCSVLYSQKNINYSLHINPKLSTFIYERGELSESQNTINYSFGGSFGLDLTESFELSSGINISLLSIDQIDYSPLFGCDFDGVGGADTKNSFFRDNYKIFYIGIPVDVKYKLGAKKQLYIKLGGEVLFKQREKLESYLTTCGDEERLVTNNPFADIGNTLFKINTGLGYEFLIKNQTFFIEPNIEYSLNSVYREVGILSSITNDVNTLEYGIKIGFKI